MGGPFSECLHGLIVTTLSVITAQHLSSVRNIPGIKGGTSSRDIVGELMTRNCLTAFHDTQWASSLYDDRAALPSKISLACDGILMETGDSLVAPRSISLIFHDL